MLHERVGEDRDMNGRAWIASALLFLLCFGGVLTLFSQRDLATSLPRARPDAPGTRTLLDPAGRPAANLGDVVPAALRRSAILQAAGEPGPASETKATLRLR